MSNFLTDDLTLIGSWQDVVDDARSTANKPPLGHEPSAEFKKRILISEHSPIRDLVFRWKWPNIKSWIATHWSRHKWECYISTRRTDRTGVVRDALRQDEQVDFKGMANVQNLIDTERKRLCYQASAETQVYGADLKEALYAEGYKEISDVLVPNCIYRGGCPEDPKNMKPCRFFVHLIEQGYEVDSTDIQHRYDEYNRWFRGWMRRE